MTHAEYAAMSPDDYEPLAREAHIRGDMGAAQKMGDAVWPSIAVEVVVEDAVEALCAGKLCPDTSLMAQAYEQADKLGVPLA